MAYKIGKRTIGFDNKPSILSYASVVGKKEHEGPLSQEFDYHINDSFFGEESFEKAESKLQKTAIGIALDKIGLKAEDIDNIFAGDLLNQCIGSSFGLRELGIPFIGLYGACSTMSLSTALASLFIDSGAAEKVIAVTSSHFCSAERQYRFPLDYGSQRTPTAQWTVTGSGALVLGKGKNKPYINSITFGEIEDYGITDANNMGAAMAPAAASTLIHYFEDTGTTPQDYDVIYTGDLGYIGTQLLYELTDEKGVDLRCKHSDCGNMIFRRESQDVHGGGSGCGCSASVLASFIMHRFEDGNFKNILFMSTGALLSPTSTMQGESIPGVAHLLNIKIDDELSN
ncbi:MAG: stage V sporulation protein AD [Ruminococcaceae bacterium]|nr:stage V sporulation protein AD [Oscillospiraceae bacterium]